jgi:hypothetical protein
MNNGRVAEQARGYRTPHDGVQGSSSGRQHPVSDPWPSTPLSSETQLPTDQGNAQGNEAPFDPSNREYRSTTFARMAARRQSTMSRLGSRILPNSVIRGLLSSEEETPAEGLAHRHGVVSRSIPRSETVHASSRSGPFSSHGSRGIRRRSTRGAYFLRGDQALMSDSPSSSQRDSSNSHAPEPSRSARQRSARLHRVRNSLSNPISHMFGPSSSSTAYQDVRNSEHQPSHTVSGEDHDLRFPPPGAMDASMDFDEPHELDSVEPAVQNNRPSTPIPPQSNGGPPPGFLRDRSSRVLRREEQTPLSRVLQLAAAAIAAQLSGATGPMVPNIQALGNNGLGGSFENFIQTLQQSASAQPNNTTPNDGPGASGDSGPPSPPSPANFLRVFRFANPDAPNEPSNPGAGADRMDVDGPGEGPEGRTVTLVVVGVRSVPSNNGTGDRPPNAGPGLDALLRLPLLSPGNAARNRDNGPNTPRAHGRSRLAPGRNPAAVSNESSGNPDANEAGAPDPSRRASDAGTRSTASSFPTVLSESPPGPNPPPSTPADPGISAVSSGTSTPSRRPSSASAMPANSLPHLHEYQSMQPTAEPAEDNTPMNTARQRRRSDSEYARHRDLGSGSVRRNGVVEPDDATPPAGRSWLIYVVGTNLSENHPAFATPSLFTDVRDR